MPRQVLLARGWSLLQPFFSCSDKALIHQEFPNSVRGYCNSDARIEVNTFGLQLNGVHQTQRLLAQLEFCDTVTTRPRRCGEYARKYFFRPPLETLTMKVFQN